MSASITGSIKFFSAEKKFGFIKVGDDEYFVNLTMVTEAGFAASVMTIGSEVEFIPQTAKGKLRVLEIKRVGLEEARQKELPAVAEVSTPIALVEVGKAYFGEIVKYDDDRGFGFIKVTEGRFRTVFFHVSDMLAEDLPSVGAVCYFTAINGRGGIAAGDVFMAYGDVTRSDYARLVQRFSKITEIDETQLVRTQVDKNQAGDKLIKVTYHRKLFHFEVERADGSDTYILKGVRSLAEAREKIGKVKSEAMT